MSFNILLADDDLDDCLFFQEIVKEYANDIRLETVNDGVHLMQLLNKMKEVLPTAIYLDLNMPRKNGFTCLNEIKTSAAFKFIPVIIFSTSFDSKVVNMLHKQGALYYIQKPAVFSDLKKILFKSFNLLFGLNDQPVRENFVLTTN